MLTAYSFIIWKLWIRRVPGEWSERPTASPMNRTTKKAVAGRADLADSDMLEGGQSKFFGSNTNSRHHNRSKKKVSKRNINYLISV